MSKETQRWAGGALGFAAAVVWTTVGAQAAVTCVLAAAVCAGAILIREGGVIGRITGFAATAGRTLQASIPAQQPPRTRPAPSRKPSRPHTSSRSTPAPRRAPQQPAPEPIPAPKPYNHDEPSSEHVYEVATYGW